MKHEHHKKHHRTHRRGRQGRRLFDYGELRLLLLAMIADGPIHGYELIKAIEVRFAGAYSPSPGVVYPTLSWLDDMGYAAIEPGAGGRKYYHITPEGAAFLAENRAAADELLSRAPDGAGIASVPMPVIRAMENFKLAMRLRLKGGPIDQSAATAIAAALDAAALAVERSCSPNPSSIGDTMQHQITRHRHELKFRKLTVKETSRLTPNMIRIVFTGDELGDFTSLGADDHVKLFIPAEGEAERRDYTPRAFDREARTLTIDFAVHDAGPATRWALEAKVGDVLEIGGPRGSVAVSPTFDWWLLVGDETALPAIGRRIEELPAGTRAISVVAIADDSDRQKFATAAEHEAIWVTRPLDRADDPAPVLAALEKLALPEGEGFVWIAAEASVARAARDYMVGQRGHPRQWSKAAGYWQKGVADAPDKSMDEAPKI